MCKVESCCVETHVCKNVCFSVALAVCVRTCTTGLSVFLVISSENYKVASSLITGLKLSLNNADISGHFNGVLVVITLFLGATLWNLRLFI